MSESKYSVKFNGQSDISNIEWKTAYNWEEEKNRSKSFFDDGTLSFFWNAHTFTVLIIFSLLLLCEAVFDNGTYSAEDNLRRGLSAVVLAFILIAVIHTPDGPFRRPHPAFWRLILCLSMVYEMGLIFTLFQNVSDARKLLQFFDSNLGKPLKEKNFGGNCAIYDSTVPSDPLHNVRDKMDGFVIVHFVGWYFKTLVLRDYWLCTVLSLMFELLEYTLEHQLPNFSECWWDHWIMDFAVCNMFGIYLGMKTLNYLSLKPYHWRGMWKIPGYKGKLKRIVLQFTPHRWTDFDWRPADSLRRWIGAIIMIIMFLLAELNTFYLKFVLWIPPPHFLCLGRLVFFLFMGAVSLREWFQFLDDPKCKRLGQQSWIICTIIITELLICIKFDSVTVTKPLPNYILFSWVIGFIMLLFWTFWHFFIKKWIVQSKLKIHSKNIEKKNGVKENGINSLEKHSQVIKRR